jgi:hypothetical protein
MDQDQPQRVELDMVEAYRRHAEEGIQSVERIVESSLKKGRARKRRTMTARLLAQLEELAEKYSGIADELAPSEEFPERSYRWPHLFRLSRVPSSTGSRDGTEALLDQLHSTWEFYRKLAYEVISEEEFPERSHRWPGFFVDVNLNVNHQNHANHPNDPNKGSDANVL